MNAISTQKININLVYYSAGTLSKTIKTIPGKEYTISFNHGNRTGGAAQKEFSVSAGSNKTDFKTHSTNNWKTETITFKATASKTDISFAGKNIAGANNSYGAVLSGISIAMK